jgi:cell wall-associated NlpC family hydrolase
MGLIENERHIESQKILCENFDLKQFSKLLETKLVKRLYPSTASFKTQLE